MSSIFRRSITTSCAIIVLGASLAACSPPNEIDSNRKIETAISGIAPKQTTSTAPRTSSAAPSVSATPTTKATHH